LYGNRFFTNHRFLYGKGRIVPVSDCYRSSESPYIVAGIDHMLKTFKTKPRQRIIFNGKLVEYTGMR
jgi:hypothetical protein